MLIIKTLLKRESDQDKSAHNRFFFSKLYMLLNRVFLFHISVNSVCFFFSKGQTLFNNLFNNAAENYSIFVFGTYPYSYFLIVTSLL